MPNLHVYTTPTFNITNTDNEDPSLTGCGPSDEEEDINEYKQGGYHFVEIGDTFYHDRYIILSKMGWGYFSTVWLAKDTLTNQHVALKIVKSDPHFCKSALEEIEILEQIQKTAVDKDHGQQYVARLLHHFWHDAGHNTRHVCMVFEVLGETLLSVMKSFNFRGLPIPLVKRITQQILKGLEFLHNDCGIVHTDIKPENILICIPKVEEHLNNLNNNDSIYDYNRKNSLDTPSSASSMLTIDNNPYLSSGKRKRLKRKMKRQEKRTADPVVDDTKGKKSSNKQTSSSSTLETGLSSLTISNAKPAPKIIKSTALDCTLLKNEGEEEEDWYDRITVKIIDLGNACAIDGKYSHVIQTRQYRSPEVIVGLPWNDRADIWSLGCLVFELITGDYLFDPRSDSKYGKDDDHLIKIVELMRVIPRTLTIGGQYSREFFNQKGELRNAKQLRYRRLRDVLHDTYFMDPDQADKISKFLSTMLEVDMMKRATAEQVLNHEWLQ
ncbi:unnamed protein product [Cunninghamella blakesleeana]